MEVTGNTGNIDTNENMDFHVVVLMNDDGSEEVFKFPKSPPQVPQPQPSTTTTMPPLAPIVIEDSSDTESEAEEEVLEKKKEEKEEKKNEDKKEEEAEGKEEKDQAKEAKAEEKEEAKEEEQEENKKKEHESQLLFFNLNQHRSEQIDQQTIAHFLTLCFNQHQQQLLHQFLQNCSLQPSYLKWTWICRL